jgi:hypothetical protein
MRVTSGMARGKYRGGKATGKRTFTSPEELEAEARSQRGGAGGRGGGGDSGRGGFSQSRTGGAGELPSDSDSDGDGDGAAGVGPAAAAAAGMAKLTVVAERHRGDTTVEAPRAAPVAQQQHRAFEVRRDVLPPPTHGGNGGTASRGTIWGAAHPAGYDAAHALR